MLRGIIQHDTLNEVNIRLSDGSKAFDYYGYTNIIFKVLKPDGTSFIDSEGENVIATSPEDGIVTIILKGQATASAGLCQSVIEIYSEEGKMTTARLNYEVFESLEVDENVESTTEYPALQTLLEEMSSIKADALVASGYAARAEKAAEEAEKWVRASLDIDEGDYATRAELETVNNSKVINDWNDAHSNGWYSGGAGTANSPDSKFAWFGRVSALTSEVCIQEVWGMVDTNVYRHCVRLVYPNSGTPWEWVNPPMSVGVEYRTTERYLGRPVYTKVMSFGAMPNASMKQVSLGLEKVATLVDCKGITSNGAVFPCSCPSVAAVGTLSLYANTYGTVFVTTTTDWSDKTANIVFKYTKTTDT